ncbi:putative clathrin assembly protein At4g02650 [Sesamum indicum]|uniref:Clathrin assembly protein At4g02650 n=1 Tax=Sesamum indicum TaxID=4182 RepID=A0A6I9U4Z0_SESIN|nr:putative clathrin assembly protein At4g02650 [Sesamum indicum]
MATSKIRKAIGVVKDHTSIGLAKVGGGTSVSDLVVAIVKATRHDENPPEDRYIHEILCLTMYSRAMVSACVSGIAKRLNRTRNWVVALKALMLVHRLLTDGDHAYEREIFSAKRHGTRFLNMSHFQDSSGKLDAWDYSAFVRNYALYLDEKLEFRMEGRGQNGGSAYNEEDDEEVVTSNDALVRATPVCEMQNESIFSKVDHLTQLLERVLLCRPTGAAKHNRIVAVALYAIVKESFQLCYDTTEVIGTLIERFMKLEIPDMIRVHAVFCRISKQYDELDAFYDWCTTARIVPPSDYPKFEKIPQQKLDMMDDFVHQKSAMLRKRKAATRAKPKSKHVEETKAAEAEHVKHVINEVSPAAQLVEAREKNEINEAKEDEKTREIGDLLNLDEDAPSIEEQEHAFALALFDAVPATTAPASTPTPWEALKNSSGDWETALVQSASHLSNQKASLPKGFDTLMLYRMYQPGAMAPTVGPTATGSSSSVAQGSAGRTAMLALPAPPAANAGNDGPSSSTDPFAASLAVLPPGYVQMSEMEKKQRFLVEEQLFWQQYAKGGMPGQVGLANVQQQNPHQYIIGGGSDLLL